MTAMPMPKLSWAGSTQSVKITAQRPFNPADMLERVILRIRDRLLDRKAGVGHLKLVVTSRGHSAWGNLTQLNAAPSLGGPPLGRHARRDAVG